MPRTVVAFHGPKPAPLVELLGGVHQVANDSSRGLFRPKDIADVHATIVGLERTMNATNTREHSDFADPGAISHLVSEALGPNGWDVQIGGFQDRDYPLASRGQRLYLRSFSIAEGVAALIGWPVASCCGESAAPVSALGQLRRSLELVGVRHKYHSRPGDVDSDLYFAVGNVDMAVWTPDLAKNVESSVRHFLERSPIRVQLDLGVISLVEYSHPALPYSGSRRIALSDLL